MSMKEARIRDAEAALPVVERYLEKVHGNRYGGSSVTKCWLLVGQRKDVWDVEGIVRMKRVIPPFKRRLIFRLEIDAESGEVIGFDGGRGP